MKTKKICKNLNQNTKICALMGYPDDAGQYCEVRMNCVSLNTLPKDVIKNVRSGHDITLQILPKCEIVVFAKSPQIMDQYVATMGENHIKDMFEAMSKYNNPEDGPLWATCNLEDMMV